MAVNLTVCLCNHQILFTKYYLLLIYIHFLPLWSSETSSFSKLSVIAAKHRLQKFSCSTSRMTTRMCCVQAFKRTPPPSPPPPPSRDRGHAQCPHRQSSAFLIYRPSHVFMGLTMRCLINYQELVAIKSVLIALLFISSCFNQVTLCSVHHDCKWAWFQ